MFKSDQRGQTSIEFKMVIIAVTSAMVIYTWMAYSEINHATLQTNTARVQVVANRAALLVDSFLYIYRGLSVRLSITDITGGQDELYVGEQPGGAPGYGESGFKADVDESGKSRLWVNLGYKKDGVLHPLLEHSITVYPLLKNFTARVSGDQAEIIPTTVFGAKGDRTFPNTTHSRTTIEEALEGSDSRLLIRWW